MKRNYPLKYDDPSIAEENQITAERLDDLFSNPSDCLRKISINNRANYIESYRHVQLDNLKGVSQELVHYSKELKYHFLNPFEALYCLESSQIIIYHRGFPLSIAEGYHLLLENVDDFKNYSVFQRLNRTGFICLEHKPTQIGTRNQEGSCDQFIVEADCKQPFEPIPCVGAKGSPEMLASLQKHGPQDGGLVVAKCNDVMFDVYERESFARNKPRNGAPGTPDYLVVVCEDVADSLDNPLTRLAGHSLDSKQTTSIPLVYAIIDKDNTICFVQFSSDSSHELDLLQT